MFCYQLGLPGLVYSLIILSPQSGCHCLRNIESSASCPQPSHGPSAVARKRPAGGAYGYSNMKGELYSSILEIIYLTFGLFPCLN